MKLLHLIWRNLLRKKVRTALTLLSIAVAFTLFGVLSAVKTAFGVGVELAGLDRLVMFNKISIIQLLPISYQQRIQATEGVADATYAVWFGGIYQDPKNFFPQHAVDPEGFFALYPEYVMPAEQMQAWRENRVGAVVGRKTADRFKWKVGDRIPLQGTIFNPPGGGAWEFDIEGIFDGTTDTADTTLMLFHYDYLNESLGGDFGQVGWYIIKVADPDRAPEIAQRLDAQFANSPAETKTATEKAFIQEFANQTGNIARIVTGIVSVVFFTMLLVAGNTMAQSVRERISELAVLKTLGYTDRQVMGLVLGESFFLAVLGGLPPLLLVWWATRTFNLGGSMFPLLHVPLQALGLGIACVVALGLVAGAAPAFQALRLQIVDALRRA